MPITVVIESHWNGDDYGEAATPEDVGELQDQITSMKKQIAARVTEATLNNKVTIVDEKVTKLKEHVQTLKGEIVSALQDGMWKQLFSQEIESALLELENRFSELNRLLDEKMMELPRLEAIEADINAIFLVQGEKMRSIIAQEGRTVCEQIRQQERQSEFLAVLSEEAQNITWEVNP